MRGFKILMTKTKFWRGQQFWIRALRGLVFVGMMSCICFFERSGWSQFQGFCVKNDQEWNWKSNFFSRGGRGLFERQAIVVISTWSSKTPSLDGSERLTPDGGGQETCCFSDPKVTFLTRTRDFNDFPPNPLAVWKRFVCAFILIIFDTKSLKLRPPDQYKNMRKATFQWLLPMPFWVDGSLRRCEKTKVMSSSATPHQSWTASDF